MRENEPVDEDYVVAQLVKSHELLERLKIERPAPKANVAIALLEQARRAAWKDLRRRRTS